MGVDDKSLVQIQSGLQGSCTELMARLLLAGLLGLALVLLTVADEDDNQVVVQDEAGQALSGNHIKALERHQRSADPRKNGKKKSIMKVKKTKEKGTKNRNKEQKKGSQAKKNARKSRKRTVNKKVKRNNRNSKGKKISEENK